MRLCVDAAAGSSHFPNLPTPTASDRPETWFHLIGGNVSEEGLTADLEAIREAGISGIHLFHGQLGPASDWPGVTNPIPCLSANWDKIIAHVGAECARLGLTLKMQNCPGWSMSGGPWIKPENAMRNLCLSRTAVRRGVRAALPLPEKATDDPARDYRDVCVLAFPTPLGDSGGWLVPDETREPSDRERVFTFAEPVTVRTLELPSNAELDQGRSYEIDTRVVLEAEVRPGTWQTVVDEDLPPGTYADHDPGRDVRQTLACDEATARAWRLTLRGKAPLRLGDVRLGSCARLEHWEGLAGWTLRGLVARGAPRQDPASCVDARAVTNLTGRMDAAGALDWTPPDGRAWTALRIGHVNALARNSFAPKEATGFECSKLSPKGIEANYAAYIGRLAKGPLKGRLDGVVVDSWECYCDNWTEGLDAVFARRCGYAPDRWLPAVFGWVVGSPSETEAFLRDWRGLIGKLIEENYYGRLAELAHRDGLTVQYETAFGDVLAGDLLEFWKYADTPMCEFWRPTAATSVGSANFKPTLPCVSAAHVYGKRRVAAEAFTSFVTTWNETLRDFKPVLDRHFAKGVTYPVFHTYTHNPQVGAAFRPPGTSFGCGIGTPFLRGQPWWPFMPAFTDYAARCTAFLESGRPVVDVLRVLGDGLGHKPDERAPHFGNRFKDDYVNRDALLNRLSAKGGRLMLPDGMSYSVLWIPEGTFLDAASEAKVAELARAGARVVRGGDPTAGLVPDVVRVSGTSGDAGFLAWYHRETETEDRYFVAAPDGPVSGAFAFRGREVALDLETGESRFVVFSKRDGASAMRNPATGREPCPRVADGARTLSGLEPGAARARFAFAAKAGERVVLDLGTVEQCAEVVLNGETVARLWCAPYRVDLTPFAKAGENVLEISVTATAYNRLLRDAALSEAERTTWTIGGPKADAQPVPAGLYGPVRVGPPEAKSTGLLAAAMTVSASAMAAPAPPPFRAGERIGFFGDSISEIGSQAFYLEYLTAIRHSGKAARFENMGQSGDTSWGGARRWAKEPAAKDVDRVFVMFGMNDISDGACAERYPLAMREIVRQLQADGKAVTLLTPSPYDAWGHQPKPLERSDEKLSACAETVRALAEEKALPLVDLMGPMREIYRDNPDRWFNSDRIHPDFAGHMLMASLIWSATGEKGEFSRVEFDAAGASSFEADYAPQGLPCAVDDDYRKLEAVYPVAARLNTETLIVKGLAPGLYELKANGASLGSFTAQALAAGVNLAERETPNQVLSRQALETARQLARLAQDRRVFGQVLSWIDDAKVDREDSDAVANWIRRERPKSKSLSWGGWRNHMLDTFENLYPSRHELSARADALHGRLAAVRPVSWRLSLTRVTE